MTDNTPPAKPVQPAKTPAAPAPAQPAAPAKAPAPATTPQAAPAVPSKAPTAAPAQKPQAPGPAAKPAQPATPAPAAATPAKTPAPAAPGKAPTPTAPAKAPAPGAQPASPEGPGKPAVSNLMKGVFSNQNIMKVGTGTTTRKTIQKTFWFVQENNDGTYGIQMLNAAYVPTGPIKTISKDDLVSGYQPEPEMYQQTVFPRMQELTKTVARAERHRQRGELFSAEFEFNNALKVDEQNIRANFGLGLTYLERAETDKANDMFVRLVKLDAAFDKEHKHLFNEFGINLRKNKMYTQAVDYYEKASALSPNDENLLYNIARAYLEEKNIAKAVEYTNKALEKNPALEPAKKLLEWLKAKGFYKGPGAAGPGKS